MSVEEVPELARLLPHLRIHDKILINPRVIPLTLLLPPPSPEFLDFLRSQPFDDVLEFLSISHLLEDLVLFVGEGVLFGGKEGKK